ncbi:expressed unknown protein [Seminavis robusta]|uniref:Uncharacterized protein n=1 Tax=Seminavis robusta TaxID=568900 RepID=A0A9N8E433_9STRA|nr:expressed unknown protein [Seminavis robusta]|eukprot:Sro642_g180110.1 n/a (203) ;mRNA; r:8711-9319
MMTWEYPSTPCDSETLPSGTQAPKPVEPATSSHMNSSLESILLAVQSAPQLPDVDVFKDVNFAPTSLTSILRLHPDGVPTILAAQMKDSEEERREICVTPADTLTSSLTDGARVPRFVLKPKARRPSEAPFIVGGSFLPTFFPEKIMCPDIASDNEEDDGYDQRGRDRGVARATAKLRKRPVLAFKPSRKFSMASQELLASF